MNKINLKKIKHLSKVIIVYLSILGIVLICFYFYRTTQTQTQKSNVYVNEKYGFEMTLPKSWDLNKLNTVTIDETEISDSDGSTKGIALGYALHTKTNEKINLPLYNIYLIPLSEWKKVDKEVVWDLGKNSKYVFGISPGNDLSARNQNGGQSICEEAISRKREKEFCTAYADLKRMVDSQSPQTFHFRAYDPSIKNYQTYSNPDYGFEIKYPNEYKIMQDRSGWTHSLFILSRADRQSYDLPVEIWKNEEDLESGLASMGRTKEYLVTKKLHSGQLITFYNQNNDTDVIPSLTNLFPLSLYPFITS